MSKEGIVQIHGKDYMTVAKRVELWHEDIKANNDEVSIETEVLNHNPVVIKAVVMWNKKKFTGISSVSLSTIKQIEKNNPYEVAETSAVGRALGFAGYGLIEGIASADEMAKGGNATAPSYDEEGNYMEQQKPVAKQVACSTCGEPATERRGTSKSGKVYHGIFCSTEDKTHTQWLN